MNWSDLNWSDALPDREGWWVMRVHQCQPSIVRVVQYPGEETIIERAGTRIPKLLKDCKARWSFLLPLNETPDAVSEDV